MVKVASIAAFVAIFSLASSYSLWHKLSFQSKVITAKTAARNQLNSDLTASKVLTTSYENFNGATSNLLGGAVTGVDNDNAKVILDALPSAYDYPALTTSIQNLLSNQGVKVDSIGGTDEAATGGTSPTAAATTTGTSAVTSGTAVAMPFTFSIDGPYQNIQNTVNNIEKSIRPFEFETMTYSGNQTDLNLTVTAVAFYQPATSFKITTEKVQ
jgi:hypothetical protein